MSRLNLDMPLVRLFVPYCTGIIIFLCSERYIFHISHFYFLAAFCFAYLIITCFTGHWSFGVCTSMLLLISGYFISQENKHLYRADHFSNFVHDDSFLWAEVIEQPVEKANTFQLLARIRLLGKTDTVFRVSGRIIIYISKDGLEEVPGYGDVIVVNSFWDEIDPPRNPAEFDYKKYLAGRNIYHSLYVGNDQWYHTGYNKGNILVKTAHSARSGALSVFRSACPGEREFAVVSALILGYREYLDRDMRREFAGAGAMHILCVSGLHVGIVFLVLKNILGFMTKLRGGKSARMMLIVAFIWLYAAITGFSPSVQRASVMFSFVAVGQGIGRHTAIINTLAASAFLLVTVNPFIVFYIGFQLSYLAVISIVILQPLVYAFYRPPNKLIERAWSIITVSLAAQVATGPLSVYYFNQFPNYFLLTNLIAIPLAGLLIHLGIATLVFNPVPIFGEAVSFMLALSARCLHYSVAFIEGLPLAVSKGIHLDIFQTLLVFATLTCLLLYLFTGPRRYAIICLTALLILSVAYSFNKHNKQLRRNFVVYSISGVSAVEFMHAGRSLIFSCEGLYSDPGNVEYNISGYRVLKGVKETVRVPVAGCRPVNKGPGGIVTVSACINSGKFRLELLLIHFDGKKIALAGGTCREDPGLLVPQPVKVDYLIITSAAGKNFSALFDYLKPEKVIIDTSHSFREAAMIEGELREKGVDAWNVRTMGAYVYNSVFYIDSLSINGTSTGTIIVSRIP